MTDMTPRFALPLLAAGQAQKEVFHNEALATLDALVHAAVESFGDTTPPSAPGEGQSWIVGAGATAAWAGQSGVLATWTAGGWRFVAPRDGMRIWVTDELLHGSYSGGTWTLGEIRATAVRVGGQQVVGARRPAIAEPAGGATVDMQARAAITAVIVALRAHGLIDV